MTKKAIEINNIYKIYSIPSILPWKKPVKTRALDNISFSCPAQQITCLLGPNGAGKTTIIKILAGLISQDQGHFSCSGTRIGLVTPNERSFYWRLTGRQNLDFFASLYNISKNNQKSEIHMVLEETGLLEDADKPFRLYSSGMKQRLLFARALLANPDILLLDEPTTHIDPLARKDIHDFIQNNLVAKKKITILLCTHNLDEAQQLAHHLVLLDKGHIVAQGDLKSLRKIINKNILYTITFSKMPAKSWISSLNAEIIAKIGNQITVTIDSDKHAPEIINQAIAHGGKINSFIKKEESMLEVFSRLTGGH